MWTNEYIKVPFIDHGRQRDGVDCWGLIILIYQDKLGISLPSLDGYTNVKDIHTIGSMMNDRRGSHPWMEVPHGEEQEFDVAVFKMSGVPMHVGLVIGGGEMIHCQKGCGTYISNYVKDQSWSRRLVGIYRHAKNSESPSPV